MNAYRDEYAASIEKKKGTAYYSTYGDVVDPYGKIT
jgi:hypothetical protein